MRMKKKRQGALGRRRKRTAPTEAGSWCSSSLLGRQQCQEKKRQPATGPPTRCCVLPGRDFFAISASVEGTAPVALVKVVAGVATIEREGDRVIHHSSCRIQRTEEKKKKEISKKKECLI